MWWLATDLLNFSKWLKDFLWKMFAYFVRVGISAGKLIVSIGTLLTTAFGLLVQMVDVPAALDSLTEMVNNGTALIQSLPVMPVFDQLNRILPVNEFLVLTGILIALQIAAFAVRLMFKLISHIPQFGGN